MVQQVVLKQDELHLGPCLLVLGFVITPPTFDDSSSLRLLEALAVAVLSSISIEQKAKKNRGSGKSRRCFLYLRM